MTIGERVCERKVILNFIIIQCKSFFRGIPGISFLERLDDVASLVHLKVTYHDAEGRLVSMNAAVYEVK